MSACIVAGTDTGMGIPGDGEGVKALTSLGTDISVELFMSRLFALVPSSEFASLSTGSTSLFLPLDQDRLVCKEVRGS